MTFSAKDAGGNPIPGAAVTLTSPTGVKLTPASGTTDANGQLVVSVTGGAGFVCVANCVVTASAVGATASAPITVTTVAATFGISQTTLIPGSVAPANPAIPSPTAVAMQIGDSLVVLVNAPAPTTSVTFATTMGSWNGSGTTVSVPVAASTNCGVAGAMVTTAAGQACATLTTTTAGLANVQVFDTATPSTSDSLTVSMTATTPFKITLQAVPTVVSKCVGTTCSYATLIATVTDSSNLPVGNAEVVFSILNPTGGGESVSPVVQPSAAVATSTLALGQARTQFTSGSLSSGASGIQIRAQVLGYPAVVTNTSPSGSDATIVIAGAAASMAFGQATTVGVTPDGTAYTLAMSVLVTDSNGSPVPAGTVVNLNAWPIAWSTGQSCIVDADNGSNKGTFDNEDANENLFLDPGEDGGPGNNGTAPARIYYYSGNTATTAGTQDGQLTPPSAAAGSVPGTITTDANLPSGQPPTGLATFTLTYPKTSAIWIVDRIRAQTLVAGSEAVSQVIFRLPALLSDVAPNCLLGNSPYTY
ncbi:MAG: Ig-like domain-containing protein [Gallionellaceae bacterium]